MRSNKKGLIANTSGIIADIEIKRKDNREMKEEFKFEISQTIHSLPNKKVGSIRDTIYSKPLNCYFLYDSQNKKIWKLSYQIEKQYMDGERADEEIPVIEEYSTEVEGSSMIGKTLKLSPDGTQLFYNEKDKRIVALKEKTEHKELTGKYKILKTYQTDNKEIIELTDFEILSYRRTLVLSKDGSIKIFDSLGRLVENAKVQLKNTKKDGEKNQNYEDNRKLKRFDFCLSSDRKYLLVSGSSKGHFREFLSILTLESSERSVKLKIIHTIDTFNGVQGSELSCMNFWDLDKIDIDIKSYLQEPDVTEISDMFGTPGEKILPSLRVIYAIERGMNKRRNIVSYYFDGKELRKFKEDITCIHTVEYTHGLSVIPGYLMCLDRKARLNMISLRYMKTI